TEKIPINELEAVIKMGAEDFTKKVAEESGIDSEREELLGVDNIFKAVDLERMLEEKGKQLKEKEDVIKEKEKQLKEKEKEIKQLKKQLDETKK
ncbi:hypothetical protein LCGC14_2108950, partial [marine sediment metagenome]